ncbi:hypothetical protein P280DRAFT_143966 [Massarina eburnea CBS 473.64]|uniref:Uncharacterized protein n=1 Tax=Massarina eburnea CBS 473.64 TaxID=1395130 RepID=A0A6A6RNT8_9PLEO|nr:hypothetical protein P280DRAFT_143966 [Massarina eburnea CBS 473.64]
MKPTLPHISLVKNQESRVKSQDLPTHHTYLPPYICTTSSIPPHPIPSHPIPSHPIPSHPNNNPSNPSYLHQEPCPKKKKKKRALYIHTTTHSPPTGTNAHRTQPPDAYKDRVARDHIIVLACMPSACLAHGGVGEPAQPSRVFCIDVT